MVVVHVVGCRRYGPGCLLFVQGKLVRAEQAESTDVAHGCPTCASAATRVIDRKFQFPAGVPVN